MRVIGLTGGIGSGKSTVSAGLVARGAVLIDADAITRSLQEPGEPVFEAMVERFGRAVVAGDGSLDRQAVADIVFHDSEALADLNAIVHPAVGAEIGRRLQQAHEEQPDVVVLDVPLLVESGRGDMAGVIVVDVDPELAIRRLVTHRGFDEVDARARVSHQVDRAQRVAAADLVIDNSGSLDELGAEIDRAWAWIEGLPD